MFSVVLPLSENNLGEAGSDSEPGVERGASEGEGTDDESEGGGGVVTKRHLTLCHALDCSPPGSSVHGTFQARTLE